MNMKDQDNICALQEADSSRLELSSTELHRIAGGTNCTFGYPVIIDDCTLNVERRTSDSATTIQPGDGLKLF